MASNGGITRVPGANIPNVTTPKPVEPAQARAVANQANHGAGRREVPNPQSKQVVDVDGKQLNRKAPRGTYLNIVV